MQIKYIIFLNNYKRFNNLPSFSSFKAAYQPLQKMKPEFNNIVNKRQAFRKQIRRQTIQQKFQKIRIQLIESYECQYVSNFEVMPEKQQSQKIRQLKLMIEQQNYYFPKFDVQNKKIQYLFNLYDEYLKQAVDQKIIRTIENPKEVQQIRLIWQHFAYWQHDTSQIMSKIIQKISRLYQSNQIYDQAIVDFLLKTIQCLILGNKLFILMNLINNRPILVVGHYQQYYRQLLLRKSYNALMNFTATNEQKYLRPFLLQISTIIEHSSYFSQIYLNIFLTENIQINEKMQMLTHFLTFLENNRLAVSDNFQMYIQIIFAIYINHPKVTGVINLQGNTSLNINLRMLEFLDQSFGIFKIRIQQILAQDPFDSHFFTILHICQILDFLIKQSLIAPKIFAKLNILRFCMRRLQKIDTVPQTKCVRLILSCFAQISSKNEIFLQIESNCPTVWISITRCFNNLANQLFFGQLSLNNNNRFDLSSQGEKLQIKCIKEAVYIFHNMSSISQYCLRYLQQQYLQRFVFLYMKCQGHKTQDLTQIRLYSLQIVCQIVIQQIKFDCQNEYQNEKLFSCLFTRQVRFHLMIIQELQKISNKQANSLNISLSIMIKFLVVLFRRIYFQIKPYVEDANIQMIMKSQYFNIFMLFTAQYQHLKLQKILQNIYYDYKNNDSSNLRFQLDQILDAIKKLHKDITRISQFQSCSIQIQKN